MAYQPKPSTFKGLKMTDYEYYMCKANDCNSAAADASMSDDHASASVWMDAAHYYTRAAGAVGTPEFSYLQEQAQSAEYRALA